MHLDFGLLDGPWAILVVPAMVPQLKVSHSYSLRHHLGSELVVGLWPYTYDSCDTGTFPYQMDANGYPEVAKTSGNGGSQLSGLPGQRLSACTCPGSDHPGPRTNKGRGAPEIDIFETQSQ
jgi:beta-glucanase (GH16 family)